MGQVVSQRELVSRRGEWEGTGQGVVCAYGTFDLLHPGHIRLLEQAHDLGDTVVVALPSDARVRAAATKTGGPATVPGTVVERPITPAAERAEILAALEAVHFAAIVDESLTDFLRTFRPDVYVCGDEPDDQAASQSGESAAWMRELASRACEVVRLPIEPGFSTSRLIERIRGERR